MEVGEGGAQVAPQIRNSFAKAFEGTIWILRDFPAPLLGWYLLYVTVLVFLQFLAELQSTGSSFSLGPVVGVLAFLSLIILWLGFLGAVLIAIGKSKGLLQSQSFAPGLWLRDLTVETVKMFLISLPWFFLLIVPGLVRLAKYAFVAPVVIFEAEYKAGRVNALKSSRALAQGVTFQLVALTTFVFLLSFFLDSFIPQDGVLLFALTHVINFFIALVALHLVANWYFEQKKKNS